jgi:hypothetical protein
MHGDLPYRVVVLLSVRIVVLDRIVDSLAEVVSLMEVGVKNYLFTTKR